MVSLTQMSISFSTMAGGGVRGKDDGTARGTTIQVGVTFKASHLFTDRFHQVGGMTIGSVIGKDINGTTNGYPTNKSKRTGAPGKRANTGRSKIVGVSKG
jgi:hypothetical protein